MKFYKEIISNYQYLYMTNGETVWYRCYHGKNKWVAFPKDYLKEYGGMKCLFGEFIEMTESEMFIEML